MARFDEYQQLVRATYEQQRKANGKLPLELIEPTVVQLKTVALRAVEQRYHPKDDRLLTTFFGQHTGMAAYWEAINNKDQDVFRPLYNWLREETENPRSKQIELLAWLIDFEGRPFDPATDYGALLKNMLDGNKAIIEEPTNKFELEVVKGGEKKQKDPSSQKVETPSGQTKLNNTSRLRNVLIVSLIVGLVTAFGVYLWKHTGPQNCMYWDGEKYESSSCSVKKDYPVQVIALDSIKQMRLKRNMRPDTLTAYSIGKVWYIDIKRKYEYYTDSGYYPLDTNLRLLKVSPGTLNKDYPRKPVN